MSHPEDVFVVELCDGKYRVTNNGGIVKAERYREPWRDLTGDGLVLSLVQEIERLTVELANTEKVDGVTVKHPVVKKWRYDALRAATGIARHYQRTFAEQSDESIPFAKVCGYIGDDIEAMIPPEER